MSPLTRAPGPYTIGRVLREARKQLPHLATHPGDLFRGFRGAERLPSDMRVAVHLRQARVMGCPVCAGLFPGLAARVGLDRVAVASAQEGREAGLRPEVFGAVSWSGALLTGDGALPTEIPEPARILSAAQRDHLLYMTRLELLVHATGLLFVPHGMIMRAAAL